LGIPEASEVATLVRTKQIQVNVLILLRESIALLGFI
jgi:hypothetical protein